MQPKILLVNPPIYDFSAYDFWLKPYGLLRVAGHLRGQAQLALFDYLDRLHPLAPSDPSQGVGTWGRGPFYADHVPKPEQFAAIPRTYRRYGLPQSLFQTFLAEAGPFDVALIQTVMTYWYPGVQEVIEDIRAFAPQTRIVLGGVYATLCPRHAHSLGADLVIDRDHLDPLWQLLRLTPRLQELPLWEAYADLQVGIVKLADGCPFKCTYCSVPQVYPPFTARPLERTLAELAWLRQRGAQHIAFYDDALLFKPDQILLPSCARSCSAGWRHISIRRMPSMPGLSPGTLRRRWCKQAFRRSIWALRAVPIPGSATRAGKSMLMNLSRPWSTSSVLVRISARSRRI